MEDLPPLDSGGHGPSVAGGRERHSQGQSLAAAFRPSDRCGDQPRRPRTARATALPTPAMRTTPTVIGSPRCRAGTGWARSTTGGADGAALDGAGVLGGVL